MIKENCKSECRMNRNMFTFKKIMKAKIIVRLYYVLGKSFSNKNKLQGHFMKKFFTLLIFRYKMGPNKLINITKNIK